MDYIDYDDLNRYLGESLIDVLRRKHHRMEKERLKEKDDRRKKQRLEEKDECGLCAQCMYELNLKQTEEEEISDDSHDSRLEELEELSLLRYEESDMHFKEIFERLSDMSERVEALQSKIKEVDDSNMLRYRDLNTYLKVLMDRVR